LTCVFSWGQVRTVMHGVPGPDAVDDAPQMI